MEKISKEEKVLINYVKGLLDIGFSKESVKAQVYLNFGHKYLEASIKRVIREYKEKK